MNDDYKICWKDTRAELKREEEIRRRKVACEKRQLAKWVEEKKKERDGAEKRKKAP